MHIKFIKRGTGKGERAARYLTDIKDHNKRDRTEVKVLRGDPWVTAEIADSLPFKHKYTSGVIAFAPTDKPTDEQVDAVIDDFERVAFAGLGSDRVAWAAVQHREADGGVHVHVLIARVELSTGKSLNIAPPGWEGAFDPLRDMHNAINNWARPDDPDRARTLQPGHVAYINADSLRIKAVKADEPKIVITDFLEEKILAGKVSNRADVIRELKAAGFKINREGEDYLSIKDEETGKKIRLKGAIYHEQFNFNGATEEINRRRKEREREESERCIERRRREFEEAVARREQYNLERYGAGDRAIEEDRFEVDLFDHSDYNNSNTDCLRGNNSRGLDNKIDSPVHRDNNHKGRGAVHCNKSPGMDCMPSKQCDSTMRPRATVKKAENARITAPTIDAIINAESINRAPQNTAAPIKRKI